MQIVIAVTVVFSVNCVRQISYKMKKGEGGTMGVGKRGGGSPLENRGGGVPFTDSFHRPGDQSLTKNIYFPRQLNGYHMVSEVLPFFTINNHLSLNKNKNQ